MTIKNQDEKQSQLQGESQKLKFFEKTPLSANKPKKLIVFLHGYGSSGKDLIALARDFGHDVPDAHFVSPNAPFDLEGSIYGGYQWFSLANRDPQIIYPQILEANKILDAFLDQQLERFKLTYSDLILVGFSQGAMMANYNALKNPIKINGVISYSGRIILPSLLGEKMTSKPRICLIHGKNDDVVPFDCFLEAKEILEKEQIPFEFHALEGLGHGIDHHGLRIGKNFLLNLKADK
ncbi:MAG: phospholipase/carboxylesterase [Rickettsiales bacterium]|jgi:phospholipase/carboxylesterase